MNIELPYQKYFRRYIYQTFLYHSCHFSSSIRDITIINLISFSTLAYYYCYENIDIYSGYELVKNVKNISDTV